MGALHSGRGELFRADKVRLHTAEMFSAVGLTVVLVFDSLHLVVPVVRVVAVPLVICVQAQKRRPAAAEQDPEP